MKKYSTLQHSSHKSSHEIIPSDNRASNPVIELDAIS